MSDVKTIGQIKLEHPMFPEPIKKTALTMRLVSQADVDSAKEFVQDIKLAAIFTHGNVASAVVAEEVLKMLGLDGVN